MGPEQIRDRLRIKPFLPFRLMLKDGSHYDVLRSQDVMPTRIATLVGIYANPNDDFPDRMTFLAHENIVGFESLVPEATEG